MSALERRIITPFEQTTYGIVSGAHRAPFNAILAIYALADKGVDAIILNGDIGDVQYRVQGRDQVFDRNATQRFTQMILHAAVMTGLPVYVQPGSHERIDSYGYVVDELAKECPNLINVLEPDNGLILKGDHQLLFLPGSDVRAGGEYGFHVDEERQTGRYFIRTPEFGSRWIHKDRLGHTYSFDGAIEFERFKTKGIYSSQVFSTNLADLPNKVASSIDTVDASAEELATFLVGLRSPESSLNDTAALKGVIQDKVGSTILFSHVPPRFSNLETAVDMAYFAQGRDGSFREGEQLEAQIRNLGADLSDQQVQAIARRHGYVFRRENRGNVDLANLVQKLGITKVVSGHFHESGGRAHSVRQKPRKEGAFGKELFWNTGSVDKGQFGILSVKGEKVAYQNLDLAEDLGRLRCPTKKDEIGYLIPDLHTLFD